MKLRTSCFNFAIFRSDVKRLWWVSALHTLGIFLLNVLPLYINYSDRTGFSNRANELYQNSTLYHSGIFSYLILGVLTVGTSVLLFSYLNSKSAVATLHAVPVKRKTLYITHTAFGIISLILPILINGAILILIRSNPYINQVVSLHHIGSWMLTLSLYALIGFSFSTLIGMFTGNTVAHLVLTYIFAVLPLLAELAIEYIMNLNLYGYVSDSSLVYMQKYLYFGVTKLLEPTSIVLYIIYTLLFFVLGYIVYKLRGLENTSEIVAFKKLKPIFIYGVSVCSGVVGYFYMVEISDMNNLFLALPLGFLGLVIANMLTKKAFTLKGVVKPTIALFVTFSAFFCLFNFDLTGFERRVPNADEIESVSVTNRSPNWKSYYGTQDGRRIVVKDEYFPNMTDKDDIENVIKFHNYKIDKRMEDNQNYDATVEILYVNYNLKNGKTLLRRYRSDYVNDRDFLKPIMESYENKMYRFPILEEKDDKIIDVRINDLRLTKSFNTYFAEKEEDKTIIKGLIEALRKDIGNVGYDEFMYQGASLTRINIRYNMDLVYDGTDTPVLDDIKSMREENHTYEIRPSYINTIAYLTELGFYDALPVAEDFRQIEVSKMDEKGGLMSEQTIGMPAQIAEIYQYIIDHPENINRNFKKENEEMSLFLTFIFNDDARFDIELTGKESELPECLLTIFE